MPFFMIQSQHRNINGLIFLHASRW